jgi:hypothetical protein
VSVLRVAVLIAAASLGSQNTREAAAFDEPKVVVDAPDDSATPDDVEAPEDVEVPDDVEVAEVAEPADVADLAEVAEAAELAESADIAEEMDEPVVRQRERERAKREREREREQEAREREQEKHEREQEALDRAEEVYERAVEHLDDSEWDQAIHDFQRAESLATIAQLRKAHPQSRWLDEARTLEVEIRGAGGQRTSPEGESTDDMKLIVLSGLMNSDTERALPLLEKFLQTSQSPKLKDKALFVLVQNGSPRAQEIVGRIARGETNPGLQLKAVKYLGLFRGSESAQILSSIYAASSDVALKKHILQSFMLSGDRARLLEAARSEKLPELRRSAIQQLGVMGAQQELSELYRAETAIELKKAMLQAMFVGGNAERLIELARTEKELELRRVAVRNLGLMGADRTGPALVAIYQGDKDHEVRRQVLNAFFLQGNAKSLVEIARKETDPELKKEAVSKLSLMQSKDATDYLIEILSK